MGASAEEPGTWEASNTDPSSGHRTWETSGADTSPEHMRFCLGYGWRSPSLAVTIRWKSLSSRQKKNPEVFAIDPQERSKFSSRIKAATRCNLTLSEGCRTTRVSDLPSLMAPCLHCFRRN